MVSTPTFIAYGCRPIRRGPTLRLEFATRGTGGLVPMNTTFRQVSGILSYEDIAGKQRFPAGKAPASAHVLPAELGLKSSKALVPPGFSRPCNSGWYGTCAM